MKQHDRQGFLGANSDATLRDATVAIIGAGGGGSHVVQQLAHLGVGHYVVIDPDRIELTNLNRLVGGTRFDVLLRRLKVSIAKRTIKKVLPEGKVKTIATNWQEAALALRECDVIIGCLDSVLAKDQLESFCRRMLIPYIDIGMDVHELKSGGFFVGGQVALSIPGDHCLRCMRVITEDGLVAEARRYGAAGGRPQVIWPNGVLASTAVGLFTQLMCPWHPRASQSALLEYDGNKHTVAESPRLRLLQGYACTHHPLEEAGDPFFDIRKRPTQASSWKQRASAFIASCFALFPKVRRR